MSTLKPPPHEHLCGHLCYGSDVEEHLCSECRDRHGEDVADALMEQWARRFPGERRAGPLPGK